jgi:hypothetical protein
MKECPTCRGLGTVKCDECNGTGKNCTGCKRDGTLKCHVCEGSGAIHTN